MQAPKRWIGAVLVAMAAGAAPASEEAKPPPPSVLLVTLDTTRADHLGSYGAKDVATPNLDELARRGVRFDQAISPVPLTLPSHATIFTGTVPRSHGVRDNALFRLGEDPATLAERLHDAGYRTAAFVSSLVLDRITGIDRGFDHYDDTVRVGAREAFNYQERAAVQTNDAVFGYLPSLEPPFFLWVHYFDPHLPYVPPEPFRSRFAGRPYDGEIAFMDDQFGRLLDAVRRKEPNLLVAVAGDHGESLGEHGEQAHGVFVYQATQHVPLLLAGPEVPQGKTVPDRVGLVDLAPTILDLLGLSSLPGADGLSLVPLIRSEEMKPRDIELESFHTTFSYGWAPLRGLVRGDEKYIEAPKPELYRLDIDPSEAKNLALGKKPDLAPALRALVGDDDPTGVPLDPALAEQRRRLEALGYVTSGGSSERAAIDPKDGIAWIADLEAGRRAYKTGKPAEGIEPLSRLLSRNPDNVPALLSLGVCYLGIGEPAKAVAADRRALELRPDDDLVHYNLANALSASPETRAEAAAHYERAVEINPRFADAYLNYAAYLESAGADTKALELLDRARAAGVRDPDVETRVAVLELKRGEVEKAEDAFRRALELNPGAAGPLEAMARITYRQKNYAETAAYLERLLETAPTVDAAATLGSIRLEVLGDRAGALNAYTLALSLLPPDDPGRESLAKKIGELSRERK